MMTIGRKKVILKSEKKKEIERKGETTNFLNCKIYLFIKIWAHHKSCLNVGMDIFSEFGTVKCEVVPMLKLATKII